ncbi:glutathione S-transferase [Syncephalis pseudoplumigaleata]|uniref:Glutathione S-transferase n=1 Tax=Syncephalis pseudoplumigaleata TaxID=1712513 RepID=A0A4P9Z4L9_9FUNG|nr:glutathione S-transferase [Syncephalis pseudoplumigaleata]|eukprot:RKP27405.1 glutathione S-transferase [Syncephalis pseudoplumigaleata]
MLKNAAITLHSIGVASLARAGNVGILLSDAHIPFQENNVPLAQWQATRKSLQATPVDTADNPASAIADLRNPYGGAPTLEIDGVCYAQTAPILRMLAREIGAYDGRDNHEKYVVDAVADIATDWRTSWVGAYWSKDPEFVQRYRERSRPRYIKAVQSYLRPRGGPYLLGDRMTYADILLYTLVYDETPAMCQLEADAPLLRLYEAVGARPKVAEYVANWKATHSANL